MVLWLNWGDFELYNNMTTKANVGNAGGLTSKSFKEKASSSCMPFIKQ